MSEKPFTSCCFLFLQPGHLGRTSIHEATSCSHQPEEAERVGGLTPLGGGATR